jgi:PIN domain nuclease of toxin-antitoxin system
LRLLLDTHALLWWLNDNDLLPPTAREVIGRDGNEVLVSAASAWEIATKVRLGRLESGADLASDFTGHLSRARFGQLAVSVEHGVRAGLLPGPHKDPFDRMLIAQAQAENLPIVSNDTALDGYGVRRLW